ncbi:MAG: M24 family metallopeptidase [Terriglobales bacterium]
MDYASRMAGLRERMRRERVDTLVIGRLPNIRYLTGFSGSNGLLTVSSDSAGFFSDSRYTSQAAVEVQGARVRIPADGDLLAAAARGLRGARRIGFEAEHFSWAQADRLQSAVGKRARWAPARGWVEDLRMIKDADEVAAIRAAVALAAGVLPSVIERLRPGLRETEVAGRVELALRRAGGEGTSFDTLVASGARAALVHGKASAKRLAPGDGIIVDYGVWLHGYASDRTRTLLLGGGDRKQRRVLRAVRQAHAAAIAAARPGVSTRAVDAAARRVLHRAGLGQWFVHSTGHGLGLEVHEAPRLGQRSRERLAAGQIVTIEPGVYEPGWGGVRWEDVIVVRPGGAEVLSP